LARVLLAWEFGGDLGHVRRLMPIARELRSMGHAVTFAFRDSAHLGSAITEGFEGFVAPVLRASPAAAAVPLNFSNLLLNLGFDDPAGLGGVLRAWQSMLELLRPDIVVADYAPTALIAARTARLPRVTVGSGFSLPPLHDPSPPMRPWMRADPGVLRALDERVVNALRAALGAASAHAPPTFADVYDADAHLLCTFPEMDPFGPRDGVEYMGPQSDGTSGVDTEWCGSGKRVFAYLKPRNSRFDQVMHGLRALEAEVIVAAPGLATAEAEAASSGAMRVFPGAVNLDRILGEADLCVCHAGAGVAARALIAGVPMALLPLQLEQFLLAARLKDGGSAELASPEDPAPGFATWFSTLLAREDLHEAATRIAAPFKGYSYAQATTRTARRIAQIAGAVE
jgi:UDP:flavonoid glycosyltransferase YjiC (YdhE family)